MAEADWKYLQYNIETGQKRTGDGPSGGASSLSDLDDTSISNPSDGQMLGYDETEGKWKNVAAPAGSVTDVKLDNQSVVDQNGVAQLTTPNIDALGKTAISNPADGEMLGYDGTEGKWKNVSAPGGNVDDVKVNGNSVVSNKVANITSYKEVTQAQYEALPDTKLSDNVLYAIKDGGQAVDGFPPLIYSDEEREVGVWRDGKPLYQKTWEFSGYIDPGAKSWNSVLDVSSLNISKLVICDVMDQEGCYHTGYLTRIQNGYLQVYDFEAWPFKYVTLRYTKTTDTPGSGTWNQQGAIAHHYSTTEKVIGTWIDGKPLYEKTFSINSPTTSGDWVSVAHGITNAEDFVSISGAAKWVLDANTICHLPIVFRNENNTNFNIAARIVNNNVQYIISTNYDSKIEKMWLTLQYTKTTD